MRVLTRRGCPADRCTLVAVSGGGGGGNVKVDIHACTSSETTTSLGSIMKATLRNMRWFGYRFFRCAKLIVLLGTFLFDSWTRESSGVYLMFTNQHIYPCTRTSRDAKASRDRQDKYSIRRGYIYHISSSTVISPGPGRCSNILCLVGL